MHAESKALFKQAILTSLPHLRPLVGKFTESYQVWKKVSESQWHGGFEERLNLQKTINAAADDIDASSAAFGKSFPLHHPEYAGMVGFRGSQSNWGKNAVHIVRSVLNYLWWRYQTFDVGEQEVDAVVQEFSDFVDSRTARLVFQTQLLNFKMPADSLQFPGGLTIRRLSEEEISQFHGGPISILGFIRPQMSGIHEFVIEGELIEPKILTKNHPEGEMMSARATAILDKAILSLRTFKDGHVGYDYIHFKPVTFCPIGIFASGSGDVYVPFGSYSLAQEDLKPLVDHANLIFGIAEEAMEMACSRLADAEHRTRPHDRIVDAVIGMEAILLAGIEKEDRKGELSFRFSLNYAMLSTGNERQHAFKVARGLYGLRSVIAHGSTIDEDDLKIAGKKMKLPEAGNMATAALRSIIMYFLDQKGFPYKNHEFWKRAYFGLTD